MFLLACFLAEIYLGFLTASLGAALTLTMPDHLLRVVLVSECFITGCYKTAWCLRGALIAVCDMGSLSSEVRWPQCTGCLRQKTVGCNNLPRSQRALLLLQSKGWKSVGPCFKSQVDLVLQQRWTAVGTAWNGGQWHAVGSFWENLEWESYWKLKTMVP